MHMELSSLWERSHSFCTVTWFRIKVTSLELERRYDWLNTKLQCIPPALRFEYLVLIPAYLTTRPFLLIFARKVRRVYMPWLDEACGTTLQENDSNIIMSYNKSSDLWRLGSIWPFILLHLIFIPIILKFLQYDFQHVPIWIEFDSDVLKIMLKI